LADARYNLSGDDVREVAKLALRHRLVLGYEAAADGVAADDIIEELLAAHPAPTVES
jgi:MoxR-like ATPase